MIDVSPSSDALARRADQILRERAEARTHESYVAALDQAPRELS